MEMEGKDEEVSLDEEAKKRAEFWKFVEEERGKKRREREKKRRRRKKRKKKKTLRERI